jgi:hypothetical protein
LPGDNALLCNTLNFWLVLCVWYHLCWSCCCLPQCCCSRCHGTCNSPWHHKFYFKIPTLVF